MDYFVLSLLLFSVAVNFVLGHKLFNRKAVLTKDAKHLIHELTTGGAVVKIEILDTSALFYRSPKG